MASMRTIISEKYTESYLFSIIRHILVKALTSLILVALKLKTKILNILSQRHQSMNCQKNYFLLNNLE